MYSITRDLIGQGSLFVSLGLSLEIQSSSDCQYSPLILHRVEYILIALRVRELDDLVTRSVDIDTTHCLYISHRSSLLVVPLT